MNKQTAKISSEIEKFNSAEQLWFWFLYSKKIRNGFVYKNKSNGNRICELLDVETLVTKLYLAGALNDEQLAVMKEFGDKGRSPHQYVWSENHKASVWYSAMQTLEIAARKKGWIY